MSCAPAWSRNGADCPHGTVFPADAPLLAWTTWPTEDQDIGHFTVLVNVFVSVLPMLFMFGFVVYVALMAVLAPPLGDKFERQMNALLRVGRYFIFGILVIIINVIQKHLTSAKRPVGSCLTDCGMPDEWSVLTGGLVTIILSDMIRRLYLPVECYGEKEKGELLNALGYYPMDLWDFQLKVSCLIVMVLAVPVSRLIVRDATYPQVFVGLCEGAGLGILFNRVLFAHFADMETVEEFRGKVHNFFEASEQFGETHLPSFRERYASYFQQETLLPKGLQEPLVETPYEKGKKDLTAMLTSLNEELEEKRKRIMDLEQQLSAVQATPMAGSLTRGNMGLPAGQGAR